VISLRLKDKVAIVTGGASGIGRESCLAFAREGAKVVVADRNVEGGEETVSFIRQGSGEAVFIRIDVTSEEDVLRMTEDTMLRYGKIDILFNNTTWYNGDMATEMSLEVWRKTIDTTLTGPFLCCKHVIKEMIKGGGGSIINTSSVGGTVAFTTSPAYNAAKGGLNLLTKNLALDYGAYQIRANCISPGIIETPLTQQNLSDPVKYERLLAKCFTKRIGQPSDIANAAIFLASDESSFITGTNLFVDNGWTAR
jgi:NAD(P)-dependent dehydrogenase (short-subunit alcohol dehydrogenase family)